MRFCLFTFAVVASGLTAGHARAASRSVAQAMPGQILTAQDDHTTAALKKAAQNDSLRKITKLPGDASSIDNETIEPVQEPSIRTEPAPGLKPTVTVPEAVPGKVSETANDSAEKTPVKNETPHEPAPKIVAKTTPKIAIKNATAEQSLKWLENGNARYLKKRFRADGKSQADRTRTAHEQKPHAIILTASDSRVTPEIIFDQAIGEVFVVRVLGPSLDSSVIASIEMALNHYGPSLLVVMGNTGSDTIAAAVQQKEGESAGSESLDAVLNDIRPRLKSLNRDKPSAGFEVESALNADGIARDLASHSEIVKQKIESGALVIKPALYWVESGKVKFY